MRIEPAIGFPDKPAIEALLAHARFIYRSKQNCRALHIESERHSPFASRSAKPQFFHVRVARAGQGVNAGTVPAAVRTVEAAAITPESPSAHPSGNASNSWSNSSAIRTTQLTQIVLPYNPYGINSMSTIAETITEGSLAVLAIAFGTHVAGHLLASSPGTLKRGAGTWRGERRSRQFCLPTGGYLM